MSGNNIMHDCRINNCHSLCGSDTSMFTIDVAVHDDDTVNWTQQVVSIMTQPIMVLCNTVSSGWIPRDAFYIWLQALQDMAANRSQWRMCCQFYPVRLIECLEV